MTNKNTGPSQNRKGGTVKYSGWARFEVWAVVLCQTKQFSLAVESSRIWPAIFLFEAENLASASRASESGLSELR